MRQSRGLTRFGMVAAIILMVAGLVRLYALDIDPALDFGAAHLTDEGYYAKNAKELLRSGEWVFGSDNHNHVYLAPLTVFAYFTAFAGFGVKLEAARACVALLSLIAIAVAGLGLRRGGGAGSAEAATAGLVGMLLLALDPALVALGRTALAEGPLMAASMVFLFCLAGDLERRRLPVAT